MLVLLRGRGVRTGAGRREVSEDAGAMKVLRKSSEDVGGELCWSFRDKDGPLEEGTQKTGKGRGELSLSSSHPLGADACWAPSSQPQ